MTPELPLATGSAPPIRSPSSFERLFTVFSSPGKTFEAIARDPHFILCWCVQIVVAAIFGALLIQRVGIYNMARQALAQNRATQVMPPASYQHALAISAIGMKISFYSAPLWQIVILLILAAVFLGLGNLLLGYEARYKQALGMVSYAYLAMTLYSLVVIAVIGLTANPTSLQITNLVGTNLAFFMDKATTSPFLYALGTHLDIFAVWTVILLGVGLAKLGGKKGKVGGALSVVVVLWLLVILVFSGISTAFA
ncbi:MAG: YIP1 family protein [Terriglobales bacterium]